MEMLTLESRARLDALFRRAAEANLGATPDRRPEVVAMLPARAAAPDCLGVLAFTVTSFCFRLVVMLGVNPGALERDGAEASDGQRAAIDALAERGNMTCGEMARELGRDGRHVGLSTPTWLRASASALLAASGPQHLSAFEVRLDTGARLDAWLAVRAYAPVEFSAALDTPAGTSGELELF